MFEPRHKIIVFHIEFSPTGVICSVENSIEKIQKVGLEKFNTIGILSYQNSEAKKKIR